MLSIYSMLFYDAYLLQPLLQIPNFCFAFSQFQYLINVNNEQSRNVPPSKVSFCFSCIFCRKLFPLILIFQFFIWSQLCLQFRLFLYFVLHYHLMKIFAHTKYFPCVNWMQPHQLLEIIKGIFTFRDTFPNTWYCIINLTKFFKYHARYL